MVSHVPMPTVMGESVDLGDGYTLWPVFYDVYWSVYAALEDAAPSLKPDRIAGIGGLVLDSRLPTPVQSRLSGRL